MFRRIDPPDETIEISVDGQDCVVPAGASVMAALLILGHTAFRRDMTGAPRGPYCGMGVCYECLVEIDGQPNLQACLAPATNGMNITTGAGLPSINRQPAA